MQTFKTIKEIHTYIVDGGWTQANGKSVTIDALKKASQAKKIKARKDGLYHAVDIEEYCLSIYVKDEEDPDDLSAINKALKREQLREKKLKNDKEEGLLVSLPEEIKRRISVIQTIKAELINSKAAFIMELRDGLKNRKVDEQAINTALHDVADLYEETILSVFAAIGPKIRV